MSREAATELLSEHLRVGLRSLRHRNFRLYFIGQLISTTGTWMQTMAQMWLVYRLTHSSVLLGLVGFAGQAPFLLIGLFGGAAADRCDRRTLLLCTQLAALLQALALGLLTCFGAVQVWHVFALSLLLGIVNVFDMPGRQAFVVDLVDRADLGNAIALNAILINVSRLAGPAAAGFLVGLCGEGPCFLLNALSYVAVLLCLAMIAAPARGARAGGSLAESWEQAKDGLRYSWRSPEMRAMLALLTVISVAGVPFMVLMPIFSDGILKAGAGGMGLLMGASGVGAVIGSWGLANRRDLTGLGRVIGTSASVFGAALVLFSVCRRLDLGLAAMFLTGLGMNTAFIGCNMLLQSLTSDAMRGRVGGLFTMTFMGAAPVGNLLAGLAADRVGVPATIALGGFGCFLAGLSFLKWSAQESSSDTFPARAASNAVEAN